MLVVQSRREWTAAAAVAAPCNVQQGWVEGGQSQYMIELDRGYVNLVRSVSVWEDDGVLAS